VKTKIGQAISRRFGGGNGNGTANGDAGDSPLEQIETLSAENRRKPDAKRESRLVQLRNEAFAELPRQKPESAPEMLDEVPEEAKTYELVDGLPTIAAADLNAQVIRAAFLDYGSLLVRGLLAPDRARELAAGIDKAFDGRDAFIGGTKANKTAPWFEPFTPAPEYRTTGKEWNRHVKGGGSVWAADSPRMMFELLETFDQLGLKSVIAEYLGEHPVFSMKKAVLRRVEPGGGTSWHQDGAFLGEGLRTLNVWLALNRCGDTSPGLDVIPKRLTEIVPTGTEGAMFEWSVSDKLVDEEIMKGEPVPRPIFEPGDALLFDHLCLHRTAMESEMAEPRYATETWCFAGSTYPDKQIPLVV
jgi:hypothetical protein